MPVAANTKNTPSAPDALTVSQLTARIKDLLEGSFPSVWVVGEISNFAQPQSGHCYFSLKDEKSQIRAVIWRGAAARLGFQPADGMEIICRGHIDVYAPRGSYQIVVEEVIPKGVGTLELALRQLRDKLATEGLFDPARKKPLPPFPRRIAVVTSPTGAAIRDFLEVLRRRWRGAHVLLLPTRVQGSGAAKEIVTGIRAAARLRPAVDVLVVTRGGGSLEDLWPFNEEPVVRAIAACRIPVISAIGHEIDVTLSDLVADVRALTPSEAAERILPAAEDVQAMMRGHQQRMSHALWRCLDTVRMRLDAIAAQRAFRRPLDRVHEQARRLDELYGRVRLAVRSSARDGKHRVAELAGRLESLSPFAVLRRGYSVTLRDRDGQVVRRAVDLKAGEKMTTRFAEGTATSVVEEIRTCERLPGEKLNS